MHTLWLPETETYEPRCVLLAPYIHSYHAVKKL